MKPLLSLLALAWVGGVTAQTVAGSRAALPQATVQAKVQAAAAAPTLSPAGEGRRVYLKLNCYGCHGMHAAGGMGPNIVGAEPGDIREKVLQGSDSGMPSYGKYVTTVDLSNLAAYLASIGRPTEPKFNDWWLAVPLK